MLGEAAGVEVAAQRAEAEGETPAFGGENAAVPAAEAKLLDASTLQPGESLAGRDLHAGMDAPGRLQRARLRWGRPAACRRAACQLQECVDAGRRREPGQLPWREPRRRGC